MFYLSSDVCHVYAQNPVIILHVWSPDFLDKEIIGQYFSRILSKKTHDLIFILRKTRILLSHVNPVFIIVYHKITGTESPCLHSLRCKIRNPCMADRSPQSGKQFRSAKRLCNVIISSQIQCFHLIPLVTSGGYHKDRHTGPFSDTL